MLARATFLCWRGPPCCAGAGPISPHSAVLAKVEVRKASKMQLRAMFLRFFPGRDREADEFMRLLPADELSMAQLQGFLLEYKVSAGAALDAVPKLLQQAKPVPVENMTVWEHLARVGLQKVRPHL